MEGLVIKVNRSRTGDDFRIAVKDLTFAYLRDPVLKGVDFTLEKGAVGLLGPNGSGKTTLLRCLLGQVPLKKNHVEVLGWEMANQARLARAGLGWMPERGGIIPGMSGVGLVAYLGELSGMPGMADVRSFSNILISVSDGNATASLAPFEVSVDPNAAPVISGTPATLVLAGAAYEFAPTASDPEGDPNSTDEGEEGASVAFG